MINIKNVIFIARNKCIHFILPFQDNIIFFITHYCKTATNNISFRFQNEISFGRPWSDRLDFRFFKALQYECMVLLIWPTVFYNLQYVFFHFQSLYLQHEFSIGTPLATTVDTSTQQGICESY